MTAPSPAAPIPAKSRLQFTISDPSWNNNHLWVTLIQAARTIVFDAGPMHVPRSLAHQVTDVCITHRHMDHLLGLQSLLRALLATRHPIRLIGPRGMATAVSHMLSAFEWNYRNELSLKIDVIEVENATTVQFSRLDIKRDFAPQPRGRQPREAIVFKDDAIALTAFDVEHHIPCLAYKLKLPDEWRVDPEALKALGVRPGPWLGELLQRYEQHQPPTAADMVPDTHAPNGPLRLLEVGQKVVRMQPGEMIGWVTDTADTPTVRARIREHLTGVDVLFCDAFYAKAEADVALKVGHLTSTAAGEIAHEVGAKQLVVTHISQRYPPNRILREVQAIFPHAKAKTAFMWEGGDEDGEAEL